MDVANIKESMVKTDAGLKETVDMFAILNRQIHDASDTILPIMREYLKDLQSVRMAFNREVQDILRATAEMEKMSKLIEPLDKLCVRISVLKNMLDDDTVKLLKKIVSE